MRIPAHLRIKWAGPRALLYGVNTQTDEEVAYQAVFLRQFFRVLGAVRLGYWICCMESFSDVQSSLWKLGGGGQDGTMKDLAFGYEVGKGPGRSSGSWCCQSDILCL